MSVNGARLLSLSTPGLQRAPSEWPEICRNTSQNFSPAGVMSPLNAVISIELDECDEMTVTGDRHLLRQLLLNLGSYPHC